MRPSPVPQWADHIWPQDHNLSLDYYSMKKLIKDLGLPVEKIDTCKNGCMLYWKDDIDLDYYKFYGDASYPSPAKVALEAAVEQMMWHANHQMEGGIYVSPFDEEVWRHFDRHIPILQQSLAEGFSGNKECQEAFDNLKEYLCTPPLLTKPQSGEKLYIYLLTSEEAPLKHILASPNTSGRMIKWVMQLSDHGIEFEPRPAIKAQVLANFISKVTKIENDMQS
ncbi:UNVERIFIED_CONTAM: hypothetical protein Scaly_2429000 [Sesamum calycinum]|uniref:Uncharacterized protein n=1 Tax=Sesamum calycinum TaxID=2727403 RepID=A0AAW2LZF8_9LAMI